MIANVYRQDFIKPGYTIEVNFHYDKDDPSFKFDNNNFLARPAAIGLVKPHAVRAYYYGLTGDGHLGRHQHHARLLSGARPRHLQLTRRATRRHQRPDGRRGVVAG